MDKYYRFNLKLPAWCKDYLAEIAWMKRTSITEYLTSLVEADAAKNPGIMLKIRENENG